jgi:outer membrane protein assembly factor BamD
MRYFTLLTLTCALLALTACKTTQPYDAYKGATAQEIFNRGESNLIHRRYEAATKDFEALDTLYPFGAYSQQSQLDVIYAYYKNGDTESALAAADRYIRLYPRGPNVEYAYYLKGLINMGPPDGWLERWGRTDPAERDTTSEEQAFSDFNQLIERFPDSPYTADARKRMFYIRNLLAQHQLEVAQFYLRRKTFIAAANRASYIVETYQGAPQVIPALAIMVQSYRALGETDMADSTQRILNLNYPDSKEAKNLTVNNHR